MNERLRWIRRVFEVPYVRIGTLVTHLIFMPVMLVSLSACAWKPEILHADATFASNDLVTGKIAIMPVKFDNDKATIGERSNSAARFLRAVAQNRPDIPCVTNPDLTLALQGSVEKEAVFTKVYDYDDKTPKPDLLDPYRQSLGARYLILSRLHYEQEASGGASSMANNTVSSTLSGVVSILDTTTGRTVWAGEFSTTRGGVDTVMDPRPSAHALPFFSTFVNAWPAPAN